MIRFRQTLLAWLRRAPVQPIPARHPVSVPGSFTCFYVRNVNGGWLAADGHAMRCRADEPADTRSLLCVPGKNRQLGFLLASDAGLITTEGELPAGIAIATKLERRPSNPAVRLLHPINPMWGLALSTAHGASERDVAFIHRDPHPDCEFTLEHFDSAALKPAARRAVQEIADSIAVPARFEPILASLQAGRLRQQLGAALLSCLPMDELDSLAAQLMEDETLRRLLRACLRDESWIATRLERLLDWRRDRDGHAMCSGTVTFQEADDIPGSRKPTAHRPKLGLALTALARRRTPARRMACVVGSARNEGPYLLDWIAHHLAVGFDHVFIYTNDNTDGSDELLGLLARAGAITWMDNRVGPESLPQFRAYAHALSILPQTLDYRWTLIADLDEYFGFDADKFTSVSDYLSWQEIRRAEAIALPWLIHAAGRGDVWRDASCTERFPTREAHVNHHVKSMFRTHLHWSSSCHNPLPMMEVPINYRAQNGMPHVAKAPENNLALAHNPQASHAWIAHYLFKSAPELLMKIDRGKGDAALVERPSDIARVARPFMSLCDSGHLVQDRRTWTCAAGATEALSRLREIRGVHECERRIKRDFSGRMAAACEEFLSQDRMKGEAEECAMFRSVLGTQRQHEVLCAK